MSITYLKGDATSPQAKGTKLIIHICNDQGGWGRGFVVAISKRWARPEEKYRAWYHAREPLNEPEPGQIVMTSGRFALGETQVVMVQPGIAVVNMIAQAGTHHGSHGPPIRYEALDECLLRVSCYAESFKASVHAPRIGCGLAGGKWDSVEPLIKKNLASVPVYIYDYP
jgi:O-acetyl-ADP-ribose deacetylase (regulator of RNase III)